MRWLLLSLMFALAFAHAQESANAGKVQKNQPQTSAAKTKAKADKQAGEKNPSITKSAEAEPTPGRREPERAEGQTKAAVGEHRLVFWTIVMAAATALLALIAGGQLGMFWKQLRFMREGVRDARILADAARFSAQATKAQSDALVFSQRAWVSHLDVINHPFQDATVAGIAEKMNGMMFRIRWTNAGHTPAINCTSFSHGMAVDAGTTIPSFGPPGAAAVQPHAPLVPGIIVTSPPCHFFDADIEALRARARRLFIHARIDYEDIFLKDTPRHTEICMEVEFGGLRSDNGQAIFNFNAAGPQNSAS